MKGHDECARHGCPPPVYEVSAGDPGDIQVRIDAAPDAMVSEDEPNVDRVTNGDNQAIMDGHVSGKKDTSAMPGENMSMMILPEMA